jgi:hypothetical protein
MKSNAIYRKHSHTTSWSQGMRLVAGIERSASGCNPEAIPSRLCKGFDPMAAGR